MIRKYHNHKLQTTPWHREEEPLNHHETPGRQIKQSNQLSLPHQDFSAKVFLILQLTGLFDIGVWKDIQAAEVQDELKIYYTRLPQLVLNSKADNTGKNYMYSFKQFSVWCNK